MSLSKASSDRFGSEVSKQTPHFEDFVNPDESLRLLNTNNLDKTAEFAPKKSSVEVKLEADCKLVIDAFFTKHWNGDNFVYDD